ncbi:unnamed protein product, partial [Mesorhabditis spiculigera]
MDNIIFVLDTTQPEMSPETNLQIYTIMEYASGMMSKYEKLIALALVFTTIVNLYALYVIWYKTPMHMKKYGRSLAAYQFVSLLMDVMLCSATVPYLIFPVPGGYPLGWMSHVGISTQLQLVLVGLVGTEMGVVMITLFMTRQQAIMPDSHPLKWSSRTGHALFIAGHLVLYLHISGMLLYMLTHDDQSAAKKIYQEVVQTVGHFQKYPFFRRFFDIESLYVFDPVIGGIIIVNLVVLFFVFLAMILAASTTSFIGLASQKQFMSAKTYKLQQQWIYNCVIQVRWSQQEYLLCGNYRNRAQQIIVGKTYSNTLEIGCDTVFPLMHPR